MPTAVGLGAIVVALGTLCLVGGSRVFETAPSRADSDRRASPGRIAWVGDPRRRRRPGAVLAALEARGNARIRQLARLGRPLYCGGHRGREIALTFDDGPGPYSGLAVRKLAHAHERATFFVVGKSLNFFPGYLPRERVVGAIGDHTYTHPDLAVLPPARIATEIERDRRQIQRRSGPAVVLFRPPYGAVNATGLRIARRMGLLTVLWTADSQDSLGAGSARIIKNVEAALRPGAIILMHENRGQTIRALTTLLPVLHRRRLRSVSIPELLATDPPSSAQLRQGARACGTVRISPRSG